MVGPEYVVNIEIPYSCSQARVIKPHPIDQSQRSIVVKTFKGPPRSPWTGMTAILKRREEFEFNLKHVKGFIRVLF